MAVQRVAGLEAKAVASRQADGHGHDPEIGGQVEQAGPHVEYSPFDVQLDPVLAGVAGATDQRLRAEDLDPAGREPIERRHASTGSGIDEPHRLRSLNRYHLQLVGSVLDPGSTRVVGDPFEIRSLGWRR